MQMAMRSLTFSALQTQSISSHMGSSDWLKNIISLNKARKQKFNKTKDNSLRKTNEFILEPKNIVNRRREAVGLPAEDIAAIRIQTAFRAFKARKYFFNLKRLVRLQMLMEGEFGKKQTSNTLRNLQTWSKIQAQIRTRRLAMAEDSGIKKKKLENQMKLDAKMEWSGSSHTMGEALARMKQREEATVKRERAMAYAFSHQWRANSNTNSTLSLNDADVAASNWGWSWMERWIAARPWESRAQVGSTPKKVNSPPSKKSPSMKKSNSPNGVRTSRNRRLSYGSSAKVEDAKTKLEKHTKK
ncbi:hypothetical protein L2E82_14965 [Cichorium intybus]|uniref:Uncharacterized protein n=1 Tax=Cichorium intybus TaxID=13427 RepID=A0ACB9F1I5_CICIN|nr:hypothetical protein L2E82_14965 [Cichorium intybus]